MAKRDAGFLNFMYAARLGAGKLTCVMISPGSSAVSNSPGTAPQSGVLLNADLGFTPYYGNLHSHTSYSDGTGTPAQAFAFARNTAPTPLDFLAVTEHNHSGAGLDSLGAYHLAMAAAPAHRNEQRGLSAAAVRLRLLMF